MIINLQMSDQRKKVDSLEGARPLPRHEVVRLKFVSPLQGGFAQNCKAYLSVENPEGDKTQENDGKAIHQDWRRTLTEPRRRGKCAYTNTPLAYSVHRSRLELDEHHMRLHTCSSRV
jgi:hypothetical protein